MLVLSRKQQESIKISDDIVVTILEIHRNKVRIGIAAPKEVPVLRSELQNPILDSSEHDDMMPHFRKTKSVIQTPGSIGAAGTASRMSTSLTINSAANTMPLIATIRGGAEIG